MSTNQKQYSCFPPATLVLFVNVVNVPVMNGIDGGVDYLMSLPPSYIVKVSSSLLSYVRKISISSAKSPYTMDFILILLDQNMALTTVTFIQKR